VIVLDQGRVVCDDRPVAFLDWAGRESPALQTPGAGLFARAGLRPLPAGVKDARATLRAHGLLPAPALEAAAAADGGARRSRREARAARAAAALSLRDVWHERRNGATVLRAVDLEVAPGELVALMGRNGAGKSTLLRHAAGLMNPTRGTVRTSGRVALLLQHPGDYVLHERVGDEASAAALAAAGLDVDVDRHPRDLSGGQRQRLALAVVLGAEGTPAVVALDEPTRGMDRAAKGDLASRLVALARAGSAVIVATHDAEFAAAFAHRVVLLADGRPIADGPVAEVLGGGWYFATETARILGGAGGALRPEEGAQLLRRRLTSELPA
jgi:energy-coupling factor transporter ATP-binding protein EcfA2